MNLTEQEQRTLTEWLGECWHEPSGEKTGYEFHPNRCKHCISAISNPVRRLDFSDWRVVGRLVEKMNGMSIGKLYLGGWTAQDPGCFADEHEADTPQEAICRAVLAYLEEK